MVSKLHKKRESLFKKRNALEIEISHRQKNIQELEAQIKKEVLEIFIHDFEKILTAQKFIEIDYDAFLGGLFFILTEINNEDSKHPLLWKETFTKDIKRFQMSSAASLSKNKKDTKNHPQISTNEVVRTKDERSEDDGK